MILEDVYSSSSRLISEGKATDAREILEEAASSYELPPAALAARLARCHAGLGNRDDALQYARLVVDDVADYPSWQAAAKLLPDSFSVGEDGVKRVLRVAVLGSSTTFHFTPLLRLAGFRFGMGLEIYEAPYGQYAQELLNPESRTYGFDPDIILLATHSDALGINRFSRAEDAALDREVARWNSLWNAARKHSTASLVQFNFVVPPEEPLGHISAKLPGSRSSMIRELNRQIGLTEAKVTIVDVDSISAKAGKERWTDPRYWYMAKEAVAPALLPTLARHTAAMVAATVGLGRKCIVLDLDNTVWGGVVGEDGLEGIVLGQGAVGEAFVAFQEYLLELKSKGLILAVCSKNNERDALEPFESHPEMRLKTDDIAMFEANWNSKPENLVRIAQTLNIGIDSLVFVDDNPVERQIVRKMLPEVEVVQLPDDPCYYVRALADCPFLETASLTKEDSLRTGQYRARAQAIKLRESSATVDEFLRDLGMQALIGPFDEVSLPRIVQLLGKTNQFNLTTRRHTEGRVREFMRAPDAVTLSVRLRDRFADHGLVALLIAEKKAETLHVDSWLMSCRVIGRGVETLMFEYLRQRAADVDCSLIRGEYIRTKKNAPVEDLFSGLGFRHVSGNDDRTLWELDVSAEGPAERAMIEVVSNWSDTVTIDN